ncbi:Membrane-bound lytic murein transglycosylase C [Saezia sanguinis]|uniref:Membrane-bound lytic murein transglycosylase C n=1 Tax=Saezia sanguinis TaxID=1965230 RepID=A0A433SEL8_9BURK|nr:lytic transglycosylase domain-containing protein [Saezia sanguinis]RUS67209.1 Membrane-bound lytic murein transglycosylase C [Saezia sanguinis]
MGEGTFKNRRQWLAAAASVLAFPGLALLPGRSQASQLEEPLTHSVRTALSAAINEAPPLRQQQFADMSERLEYLNWLGSMSDRLASRIPNFDNRIEFLETVWYESKRAGLETALVLGLIQTESAFKQYAVSVAGALGYMQVMPFWTRLIGDGDVKKLFHAQTNLRYGCVILRHYMDIERGDLFMALGRYNGSRGRDHYPNTVFNFRQRWIHEPAPVMVTTAVAEEQ